MKTGSSIALNYLLSLLTLLSITPVLNWSKNLVIVLQSYPYDERVVAWLVYFLGWSSFQARKTTRNYENWHQEQVHKHYLDPLHLFPPLTASPGTGIHCCRMPFPLCKCRCLFPAQDSSCKKSRSLRNYQIDKLTRHPKIYCCLSLKKQRSQQHHNSSQQCNCQKYE